MYYDGKKILTINKGQPCDYSLIIGERSNGKTFCFMRYVLERFKKQKELFVYLRRWESEFQGSNSARNVFDTLITPSKNYISEIFGKEYDRIEFWGGRYFLCKYDDNKGESKRTDICVGYGLILSHMEKYKSTSYNNVNTIIFDEFLTRGNYINNEFIIFSNMLSTIIRDRGNVNIFMLGNTVSKYGCPYFKEMMLKSIDKQKQGTIDVYEYEGTSLTVAVEYCANNNKNKKSNKYFNFSNPQLLMIQSGQWEIPTYPHLMTKYKPKNVIYKCFLEYEDNTLECEVIRIKNDIFGFWHNKTTPIKDTNALIYSDKISYKRNVLNDFNKPTNQIGLKIRNLYIANKMFYSDNEVGEIVFSFVNRDIGWIFYSPIKKDGEAVFFINRNLHPEKTTI